ncbi:unknown [Bacteroides sp. CAG:661]|nr:unknown [Bacteroides sp. CAG:661]
MKEVIVTAEIFGMPISFILLYEFIKLISRYILDNLGKYKFALIHNPEMLKLQDNKSFSNQKIN